VLNLIPALLLMLATGPMGPDSPGTVAPLPARSLHRSVTAEPLPSLEQVFIALLTERPAKPSRATAPEMEPVSEPTASPTSDGFGQSERTRDGPRG
jgi:hypothetical protein